MISDGLHLASQHWNTYQYDLGNRPEVLFEGMGIVKVLLERYPVDMFASNEVEFLASYIGECTSIMTDGGSDYAS
jgi:hypothetical protein